MCLTFILLQFLEEEDLDLPIMIVFDHDLSDTLDGDNIVVVIQTEMAKIFSEMNHSSLISIMGTVFIKLQLI